VAEGCPHLRTQYQKHPSEDQRSGKKREQRMIDFLPGIVLAEGRLGALAQEIGESSLYIPPITGFEPHGSAFSAQRSAHNVEQQSCDKTSSQEFVG
jgi:hypothetical protein